MAELEGRVENIIFQNQEGTYCVFRLLARRGTQTVVYRAMPPFLGEEVVLEGEWKDHPRFGRQFMATSLKAVKPETAGGIRRFLAAGSVRGVGEDLAKKIVAKFGDESLEIIAHHPERLCEIRGIGAKSARMISESYNELEGQRELMLFLEEHRISASFAGRIEAAYGSAAIEKIKENPYALIFDVDGIGFQTADMIALKLGFERNGTERIRAGLVYALSQAATQGHVCLPEDILVRSAAKVLALDEESVGREVTSMMAKNHAAATHYGGVTYVYPNYLYRAEEGTAKMLLRLKDNPAGLGRVDTEKIMADWEKEAGITLARAQKDAISQCLDFGVLCVTGGPGTGKTTIIKGIRAVLKKAGCKVLLAAPTGRAARRLAEAAGDEASTVHRLLEFTPLGEFGKNSENLLDAQAVIVDEASMLDLQLTYHLLDAIPLGCRLILVGDVDQLPSVGPGSVLKDIIRCGKMPVARLNEVFRQQDLSPIVANAHKINHGQLPDCVRGSDFEMEEFAAEDAGARFITDYCAKAASRGDFSGVQVLSPMHKGACGVDNLNILLQEKINPPRPGAGEIAMPWGHIRVGDKVMQTRNNYEKEVYNGDTGIVKAISGKNLLVHFSYRDENDLVLYEEGEAGELELAYAMSVHKSQGSEYPEVVMVLMPSQYIMLQRNLLYTGVTRAKKKVVLVGTRAALATAVGNDRTRRRWGLLAERMQHDGEVC